MIDSNRKFRYLKTEKEGLSKVLKCAEIVEKILMRRKTLIGVAELTILNLEEKFGGAV